MAQRRRSGRRQSGRESRATQAAATAALLPRRTRPTSARPIPKAVLLTGGILLVLILAVIAANWFFAVKRPADAPILEVNKRVFRWSEYIAMLRFQKLAAEHLGGEFQAGQEPYSLMQIMAENELISQSSAREGLQISDAELREELISRLVPNAKEIADPGQLERELGIRLGVYTDAVRLSREQYETIVKADLLRRQLGNKLGENIPRVQPQAYIHLIQAQSERSEEVQRQLKEGVAFETVARRFSQEPNVESNGGDIGWLPRSVYPELDNSLFGWKEGETGNAIETPEGWWLVRVVERSGNSARLQGILLADLDAVDNVQRRLRSGGSFTDLAAEFSIDSVTRGNRGEMGTVAVGERGGAFDEPIQGIERGELIGPVLTHDTAYFAIVKERSPAQEIAAAQFETLKVRALEGWMDRERAANYINYCPGSEQNCFGSVKVDLALKEISTTSLTRAQENATATARAAQSAQQPPQF
ncbi:MAG: PpiC-type peptidyl-prolyl cis-trans isomerase [Dehalococcoidia bacterium]|nr:PpiC-type peptidyl-prolyl cis-trans isomerase [Dehalococcoidia bacterium]